MVEDINETKKLDPTKLNKLSGAYDRMAKAKKEMAEISKKQKKEDEVWIKNMERMQELAQKVGDALGVKVPKDIGATTKNLSQQGTILTVVRKKWAELTGAIIGSFYTIAKLSPLFASYISEFGGVLGYVYDTAIEPWQEEIEWLLDLLWAFGDWLKEAPEGLQKFAGALLIGIPVLTGIAVAILTLIAIFNTLMGIPIVGKILTMVAGFKGMGEILAIGKGALLGFAAGLGLLLGVLAVMALDKLGVLKWIADLGKKFRETADEGGVLTGTLKALLIPFATLGNLILVIAGAKSWDTFKNDLKDSARLVENLTKKLGPLKYLIPNLNGTNQLLNFVTQGFATGGSITKDGIYKLHAGETVIPATQVNNSSESNNPTIIISPNIYMNGSMGTAHQVRMAAEDMSQYWLRDIRKVMSGSSK